MLYSIRLNKEEKKLVASYIKLNSISISEAFKRALFEKIEDEYDASVANEYYIRYINSGKKSKPIDKLWKELNI